MDYIDPECLSVIDPAWEVLDPNPNLQELFMSLNHKLFKGKLMWVEVKWSRRMTQKAGLCRYKINEDLCTIYISKPLLSLRSRRDLVEVLLHEMIHAYLFVTHKYKDEGAHGPEFCRHMKRLNNITGANISIYHNFHAEVAKCRKHWWLCNGPCRAWGPKFGFIRRAMNRAPSARERWWSHHQVTCGGTFLKVNEPKKYVQKGRKRSFSSPTATPNDNSGHELPSKRARMDK
ncbi:DNA-dependent metalloprotease SPRTN-like [Spea bombifrons]|uniref:DNA-dependent metalloprotease SPRTN-like n=1 Tax=Spea bombifrons TaxID=233779 RepID=UPI00234C002F|nr:DNA-dependent metalloprotease SPRTN-like [Spea bombifrons]